MWQVCKSRCKFFQRDKNVPQGLHLLGACRSKLVLMKVASIAPTDSSQLRNNALHRGLRAGKMINNENQFRFRYRGRDDPANAAPTPSRTLGATWSLFGSLNAQTKFPGRCSVSMPAQFKAGLGRSAKNPHPILLLVPSNRRISS